MFAFLAISKYGQRPVSKLFNYNSTWNIKLGLLSYIKGLTFSMKRAITIMTLKTQICEKLKYDKKRR